MSILPRRCPIISENFVTNIFTTLYMPKNNSLLTASWTGEIIMWDASKFKMKRKFRIPGTIARLVYLNSINAYIALTLNFNYNVTQNKRYSKVSIYNMEFNLISEYVNELSGILFNKMEVSCSEKYVVISDSSSHMSVIDLISGRYIPYNGPKNRISFVKFDPIDDLVYFVNHSNSISCWDFNINETTKKFIESSKIRYFTISRCNNYIAMSLSNHSVILFIKKYNRKKILIEDSIDFLCLNFSNDLRYLVGGTSNGSIYIWSLITYTKLEIIICDLAPLYHIELFDFNSKLMILARFKRFIVLDVGGFLTFTKNGNSSLHNIPL